MKLTDMDQKPSLKKLSKLAESRFNLRIDYDKITLPMAQKMSSKIMETVNTIRRSSAVHTAEKNPKYLEMLIVYEGLQRWIEAYNQQLKEDAKKPALVKRKVVESKRKLKEGELGKAEAALAAKDMVDSVQDMIEKAGKMQNEQLPALIDSIRDQIGSEQAEAFKGAVMQSLTTLIGSLGQTREGLDIAARTLTGEQAAPMAVGGMPPADPTAGGVPGLDAPAADQGDGFGATDAAAGGPAEVGRELR